jgi:hypothetical protein
MDEPVFVLDGIGEYGFDPLASPGNGPYYVKLYDGSYDASGFDSLAEARAELAFLAAIQDHSVWYDVEPRRGQRPVA